MRLEQIPLFIGVIVAILGLGLVLDAQLPERSSQSRERRRRERAERHRTGETLVGLGVLAMGASLIGRDTWRFGTLTVLAGALLLAVGAWLNREYLREMLFFRGAARRGEKRRAPRVAETNHATSSGAVRERPPVHPGLADVSTERTPAGRLRGDREAPIMTATEGVQNDGKSLGDDTSADGHPRLRIR